MLRPLSTCKDGKVRRLFLGFRKTWFREHHGTASASKSIPSARRCTGRGLGSRQAIAFGALKASRSQPPWPLAGHRLVRSVSVPLWKAASLVLGNNRIVVSSDWSCMWGRRQGRAACAGYSAGKRKSIGRRHFCGESFKGAVACTCHAVHVCRLKCG